MRSYVSPTIEEPRISSTNLHALRYRPDIDGLRGIAVLAVLFYHLGTRHSSGGFVGVDVFFVISGYLITSILAREMEQGTFLFHAFYLRRMRRIFPALFVVLFVCTAFAMLAYTPAELESYGKTLLATTLFASNVYFEKHAPKHGYFDLDANHPLLLHSWSLSVEEQFYLIFPLLLFSLFRLRKWVGVKHSVLACAVVSFAASLRYGVHNPVANFYLLPTRAWELLIGALLSLGLMPAMTNRILREFAGFAGLGMIAYAVTQYNAVTPFPGRGAMLPAFGALLLLASGEAGVTTVNTLLRFPPLVWTGLISYSLYLWHWVIFNTVRYVLCIVTQAILPDRTIRLMVIACFVMAASSYLLVELPFRGHSLASGTRQFNARQVFWMSATATVALLGLATVLIGSKGMPGRFDAHTQYVMASNEARVREDPGFGRCATFEIEIKRYSDVPLCEFGNAARNILVLGDSHAGILMPLLIDMQSRGELHGQGVAFAFTLGCPPAQHLNITIPGHSCDMFTRFAIERALKADIDTVYIQFYPWWLFDGIVCVSTDGRCDRILSSVEARQLFLADLTASVETLRAAGKRVVIGLPFPSFNVDIASYENRHASLGRWLTLRPQVNPDILREPLLQIAAKNHAEVYDPRLVLCQQGTCIYEVAGVATIKDDSHLARSRLGVLRQGLASSLSPPLRTSP